METLLIFIGLVAYYLYRKIENQKLERLNPVCSVNYNEISTSSVQIDFRKMNISFENRYNDYPGFYFLCECDLIMNQDDLNDPRWLYKEKSISYSCDNDGSRASNMSPEDYYTLQLVKLERDQQENFSHLAELELEEMNETLSRLYDWKEIKDEDIQKEVSEKFNLLRDHEKELVKLKSIANFHKAH